MSDHDLIRMLGRAGPAFFGNFTTLRDVQRECIRFIRSGENVLVCSATASGKTEAIFAPLVARLDSLPARSEIRLLAVAPTRALVNDLYLRIEGPLSNIGWSCGRQTSDHRDKSKLPNVLITTPESFDSMLVRDSVTSAGATIGHLLASVEAVFVDEAHLFDASPRGDQLIWLLQRLRRLKQHAAAKSWIPSPSVQTCAASATIGDPARLAKQLLGDARVVQVAGTRSVQLKCQASSGWTELSTFGSPWDIAPEIVCIPDRRMESIVEELWRAIEDGVTSGCRKALVFVPSRSMCDRLSVAMTDGLRRRRNLYVGAHHGSLERKTREHAEHDFAKNRDAVLVATTTLEVGIDIGDVDLIVLVGAPSDTQGLLQRIGRAGRRAGAGRIVAVTFSDIERAALASMLHAGVRGQLDIPAQGRIWSVFVQQAASYSAQSRSKGRRRTDLLSLATSVWPDDEGRASSIIDHLVAEGFLVERGERLFLGEEWSDAFESWGGGLHANFDASNAGIAVIDAATGEPIAHVAQMPATGDQVPLAGRRWSVRVEGGEVLIEAAANAKKEGAFRYATRSAPTAKSYAEHVRRGLGFEDSDSPIVRIGTDDVWFHFGGSTYEKFLCEVLPHVKPAAGLAGLALCGAPTEELLWRAASDRMRGTQVLRALAEESVLPLSLGRYHRTLPPDIRATVALARAGADQFWTWLSSRRVHGANEAAYARLIAALKDQG